MSALLNSNFLQLTSWHSYPDLSANVVTALGATGSVAATSGDLNVALILPRANDPTALLESNWATRQTTLASLNDQGTLWQTYGADQGQYTSTMAQLQAMGVPILGQGGDGYVTSAASRTIWVHLDTNHFNSLFSTPLQLTTGGPSGDFFFWNGNLTLPNAIPATELFFDYSFAQALQGQSSHAYTPPFGPQSIGNAAPGADIAKLYPQQIAALYDFPLNGNAGVSGTLGLIEPGVGSSLPASTTATFGALLGAYLTQAGVGGSPSLYTVDGGGQKYSSAGAGERSLDIGVTAAVNPGATFGFYAGSGGGGGANSLTFTAYHSAIWDMTNNPTVLSSSWSDNVSSAPGSPFFAAYQDLYVDAALRNMSVFIAAGDGGSGAELATGLNNFQYASSSPFTLVVGGTSLTLAQSAPYDPTVGVLLNQAQSQDPAVLWALMQAGLTTLPTALPPGSPLLESVWNQYSIESTGAFANGWLNQNVSGAGGVDPRLAVPGYQSAYGLTPTDSDSTGVTGRGLPDVSALAGGDTAYIAPLASMLGTSGTGGTSAATPLWASLALQVDTIFHDQGLPSLGYAIDLLYIASVIAPGSFNDVQQGNNISSYTSGSGAYSNAGVAVTPTGFGYFASPGYDLATGLGSPNGVLLARALTAIAHEQMSFGSSPPLLDQHGSDWTSGADQSLLFQTLADSAVTVGLGIGQKFVGFASGGASAYAWTSQLAEQSLQAGFDPNLIRLFDKQGQGALMEAQAHVGEGVAVAVDTQLGSAIQASLSNPFGFADFFTSDGAVRVARPVAVAETVGDSNDQTAIVRVRQVGTDNLAVTFYRTDDFSGKIGDLNPGDPGYAQAASARAYQLNSGGSSMGGPGYGNFQEAALLHVNGGDKIAMVLTDNSTGAIYWAFSQANETFAGQKVSHLWNYGLNTWGWEDTYGGGDHDFNDMVVQLDFTSASGHGWLV
ncbi:hypothetical protein BH11PSE3_BH11PSE3_26070 [soil metagenome]